MQTLPLIRQLLDCWNIITGQTIRMIPSVERALYEFSKPYSKDDLEMTLNYMVFKNRKSECPWSLRFEKLFDGEFVHFESLRAEAEQHQRVKAARARAWKATPADKALEDFRRTETQPPETPARMSKELLASELTKLGQQIGKQ